MSHWKQLGKNLTLSMQEMAALAKFRALRFTALHAFQPPRAPVPYSPIPRAPTLRTPILRTFALRTNSAHLHPGAFWPRALQLCALHLHASIPLTSPLRTSTPRASVPTKRINVLSSLFLKSMAHAPLQNQLRLWSHRRNP